MITRAEWKWVGAIAVLTLLVSSLPIIVGYAAQTPRQRFVGAVYDVQDYFSHLAKIQLGLRGEYRYRSLFTSEPHPSEPIIYTDILLGALARPLGVSPAFIYEVSRLLGGLALLAMVYKFVARHVDEVALRRLVFILAIVASGLGWLVIATPAFSFPNQSPIEFWLADGYLLFSIMAFPHFGWSIAALLAAFLAWQDYAAAGNRRHLFWLIAFSSLLGLIQIFELALLDVVIGLDALRRLSQQRHHFSKFVLAGGLMLGLQGVMVWPYVQATQTNPLVQVWAQQSRTLSPPPHYYLLGYGVLWLFVALGLAWAWRQRSSQLVFPAIWLGAVAGLVYSPNGIQYRWLAGVQVPLSIFAGIGLTAVAVPWLVTRLPLRWKSPRTRWWITVLSVVALMPSNLYLVAGNSLLAAIHWKEAFVTSGQVSAIEWLQANTNPEDVVLADLKIGNALPGWIGQRTFYGHWAETINFNAKTRWVQKFFSDPPETDRRTLLRDYGIRFVFYGPQERELGNFNLAAVNYLVRRYANDDTSIYEVVTP